MLSTEVRKLCRKVENPTVDLPSDCELYDDEDFVYLVRQSEEEVVATFNAFSVNPQEIVKAAQK